MSKSSTSRFDINMRGKYFSRRCCTAFFGLNLLLYFVILIFLTFINTRFELIYIHTHHGEIQEFQYDLQRPRTTTEQWKEVSQQRCLVPKLNPFHADALRYLSYRHTKRCEMKRFGEIQNGRLYMNLTNVHEAWFRYIRRKTDFVNELSDRIFLLKPARLKEGKRGCLEIADFNRVVYPESMTSEYDGRNKYEFVKLSVFESSSETCTPTRRFYVTKDKHIFHLSSSRCLIPQGNVSKSRIILSKSNECSKDISKFDVVHNRSITFQHRQSKLCISYFPLQRSLGLDDCNRAVFNLGFQRLKGKQLVVNKKLSEELIRIQVRRNNRWHEEYHAHVHKARKQNPKRKKKTDALNVLLLMIDSTSNANFQRHMNRTFRFLSKDPNTVILKGHTIVGDGTTAQLCAMLTGMEEHELPEARRSANGSEKVDKWPFIFKDFQSYGYRTLFSEDDPVVGSFNYRLNGFHNPPTSDYLRPIWLEMEKRIQKEGFSCPHEFLFDYLKMYFTELKDDPKFMLAIMSHLAHHNMNRLSLADVDVLGFYEFLARHHHSNNTVVFLFGDHGPRASEFRSTIQGKLEERLPFMSITLPNYFRQQYPNEMKNLRENSEILTSHYDIYATLQHLIQFPELPSKKRKYGRSLFENIHSLNRTCMDAGVETHWCPCLHYEEISPESKIIKNIAAYAINKINSLLFMTKLSNELCTPLSLKQILRAGKKMVNTHVQSFNGTAKNEKCDSCGVNYINQTNTQSTYEIVLSADPSNAQYEVTADVVEYANKSIEISINSDISRTNFYGKQPSCIADRYPELRKFCYCKIFVQN